MEIYFYSAISILGAYYGHFSMLNTLKAEMSTIYLFCNGSYYSEVLKRGQNFVLP